MGCSWRRTDSVFHILKRNIILPLKFSRHTYPANPNGSDYDVAGLCSEDGRHLVMMPHLERAYFPWQCGYYPSDRKNDEVTPWIKAFVNAQGMDKGKKPLTVRKTVLNCSQK